MTKKRLRKDAVTQLRELSSAITTARGFRRTVGDSTVGDTVSVWLQTPSLDSDSVRVMVGQYSPTQRPLSMTRDTALSLAVVLESAAKAADKLAELGERLRRDEGLGDLLEAVLTLHPYVQPLEKPEGFGGSPGP
jgi:hypothetical protein